MAINGPFNFIGKHAGDATATAASNIFETRWPSLQLVLQLVRRVHGYSGV
jgi:hypothetical protein